MNRLLLVVNVVLALFLAIRLAQTDAAAAPRGAAGAWTATDVRETGRTVRAAGRVTGLTLDLGAELGEPDDAAPADLGLRLEPNGELHATLAGPRTLELAFPGGLQPGRRFHLHLARAWQARDGRALAPGMLLAFATPTVALQEVIVDEAEGVGAAATPPALLVAFDQPVDLAAVQAHLSLRDPAGGGRLGRELPCSVTAVEWHGRSLFRVVPAAAAVPERVTVAVAPGLVPRGGDVPTAREQRATVVLREPLRLLGAETGDGAVVLSFNRRCPLPEPGLIEVEPAVPFQTLANGTGLRLVGDFPAGSVLGVTLRAGFPDRGRHALDADARRSLLLPDREPAVDFAWRGSVLSARARPVLAVRGVNVERVRTRARRVYPNNVVRMLQRRDDPAMAPGAVREFAVAALRNQEFTQELDLRELCGGEEVRGLWQVELWDSARPWPAARRLLQVTDLGVSVRAAQDAAAVQVVSIADGTAVVDAAVSVVSPTNQTLARGRTDGRGIVVLRWPAGGDDHAPFLVQVESADDRAFVDLDGHAVELADPTLAGRPYLRGDLPEAWVWPTRSIARPGERVDAAVLVRAADGGAAVGREVVVEWQAPNGRAMARSRAQVGGSGMVTAGWQSPVDAPAGTWRVRVLAGDDGPELGAAPLQVEAFVPYRLEAEVAAAEPLRFGQTATVRVRARWLDGAPAAGRPVEVRARLLPGSFVPEAGEGYSFRSGADAPPPGELPSVRGVLDEAGVAELRLQLPADAPQQALTAHLSAEVADPSGRAVRAAAAVPLLRSGLHLGVRHDAAAGAVRLLAVSADGEPAAGEVAAIVRLERRRWGWHYQGLGGARWRWITRVEREALGEWPITLRNGAGEVALPAADAQGGWLAVVATADGVSAEVDVGQASLAPDRLRVAGPVAAVAAGGTARLTVDAPAAGRGFVTLEGPTVLAAHVVELVRGHNEVFVPIPAGVRLPNLHAVVTLTRPARQVGPDQGPAWLVGGAAVPLLRDDLATAVTLRAPAGVLPEGEVRLDVHAPGASAVLVAVVDEGVLAITGHGDPDPAGHFLARRRLAVQGADAFAALMQGATYVPGTRTGGDGDESLTMLTVGSISPRIRPLALATEVVLDREGRGTATFRLPPYEGRVRAMVVAAGPRGFGGAAAPVVVQAPLGLQVATPRMVAPGDRFAVPVTLRNDTGGDGAVALSVRAEGAVGLAGDAPATLPLAAGAVATVEVWLRAQEPQDGQPGRLVVAATLGDATRTVSVDLHVRTLRLLQQQHFGLRLGEAQQVRIPDDFAAEDLGAVLTVDAVPDRQLAPALEALVQYPYGCVEQTTSRGLALLACAALLDRIHGGEAAPLRAEGLVDTAVGRLLGMQRWNGGFGWWADERSEFAFGTVYALDFLLAAREAGHDVPEAALRGGLQRLEHIAATADLPLRAFACEVLARAGAGSRARVEWLGTQVRRAEDRTLVALALAHLGDRARARVLLAQAAADAAAADDGAGAAEWLASPLRARALRFRAVLAIDPADPRLPELAWSLQQELLRPGLRTTQELGQALRALALYYRAGSGQGPASVTGTLDGAPLPPLVGGRVELPVRPGSVLALDQGSRGYALLSVRGLRPPRAAPADAEPAVELRRVLVDPETGAEATELRRGRVYEVHLIGRARRPVRDLVIADLLPGGLEAEAPPPGAEPVARNTGVEFSDARIERRDDRVLLFRSGLVRGSFHFVHLARATLPGSYSQAAPVAEAMYEPGLVCTGSTADGVEIRP